MHNQMPKHCPACGKEGWEDLDMDTGEVFCFYCGEYVGEEEE